MVRGAADPGSRTVTEQRVMVRRQVGVVEAFSAPYRWAERHLLCLLQDRVLRDVVQREEQGLTEKRNPFLMRIDYIECCPNAE